MQEKELVYLLRSVIQEELKPIKEELQSIKSRQVEMYHIQQSLLHAQQTTHAKLESLKMDMFIAKLESYPS